MLSIYVRRFVRVVQASYMPLQMCVFSLLNIKKPPWPTAVGLMQPPSAHGNCMAAVYRRAAPATAICNRRGLRRLDLQLSWPTTVYVGARRLVVKSIYTIRKEQIENKSHQEFSLPTSHRLACMSCATH
jgi:hypothetical protein